MYIHGFYYFKIRMVETVCFLRNKHINLPTENKVLIQRGKNIKNKFNMFKFSLLKLLQKKIDVASLPVFHSLYS